MTDESLYDEGYRDGVRGMKATYAIAHAAGRDAGNRLMLKLGLTAWNEKCWAVACETFEQLYDHKPTNARTRL